MFVCNAGFIELFIGSTSNMFSVDINPKITFFYFQPAEFSHFCFDTLHEILHKRIWWQFFWPMFNFWISHQFSSKIFLHFFFNFLRNYCLSLEIKKLLMEYLCELCSFRARLSPIAHFQINLIVLYDSAIKIL